MMIGGDRQAVTSISTADAGSLTIRGHDLCSELMGRVSFTEYFFLLMTGRTPTQDQTFFLDLLLVAIAEHGLVPTNQVARMTLAADPASLQGAVAAGILGCGSVILGSAQECGELLTAARSGAEQDGVEPEAALRRRLEDLRAQRRPVPGFGHPLHKPVDPRAQRILSLADERGVAGAHVVLARASEAQVAEIWGKPLPLNVSMAIAAVLLDIDFPPTMLKAIPILARTASLLAHLAEEQQQPIGFLMAGRAEESVRYVPAQE